MDSDLLALKAYVAKDGIVWFISTDGPPTCSKQPVGMFLMNPLSLLPRIRLIASPRNVHLILSLYSRKMSRGEGIIEVCSPKICRTSDESNNPEHALLAMRKLERSVSTGGWHTFGMKDYPAYALTSYVQKTERIDDAARRLLKDHPVWPSLSFIPHIDVDACAALLALILDPRWYVDLVYPSRGSKLRTFLGLNLKTLLGVCKMGPKQRYHERCKLVLTAWGGDKMLDSKQIERPEYFLWRIFKDRSEKGAFIGSLRASQAFVDFIRLTWLSALGRGRHQLDSLFVPSYFFNREYESDAFAKHALTHREM